jgi:hypothetical protein
VNLEAVFIQDFDNELADENFVFHHKNAGTPRLHFRPLLVPFPMDPDRPPHQCMTGGLRSIFRKFSHVIITEPLKSPLPTQPGPV